MTLYETATSGDRVRSDLRLGSLFGLGAEGFVRLSIAEEFVSGASTSGIYLSEDQMLDLAAALHDAVNELREADK